jgi:hypothetical protein
VTCGPLPCFHGEASDELPIAIGFSCRANAGPIGVSAGESVVTIDENCVRFSFAAVYLSRIGQPLSRSETIAASDHKDFSWSDLVPELSKVFTSEYSRPTLLAHYQCYTRKTETLRPSRHWRWRFLHAGPRESRNVTCSRTEQVWRTTRIRAKRVILQHGEVHLIFDQSSPSTRCMIQSIKSLISGHCELLERRSEAKLAMRQACPLDSRDNSRDCQGIERIPMPTIARARS